ncbi:hypothetical protein AUK40_01265 [Candidatus Wirthbacteria bacterium CG2_30_54_11]|uniref:YtxH domain-containing protein n=1 Tax=Candidatus Wirthbacteria bacterium CG2_30_54_11 TaxID=1817892 RepID=A0A1J5J5G7_9BACT|nr:MAG: hypothetical protein AUK40_01265 [Candidatus Wirthbacteria bacterium CG2_30_54_11]
MWGVIGGVILGLLYAPQDGEKTRESVMRKFEELKVEAEKHLKELDACKDRIPGIRSEVEEQVTRAKQRVKEEIQTAKEALEKHLAEKQQG